ncbi:hypothetical protein NDU88_008358 [Pleurodeles waltl]|uniref:Immunoglobulin V-set domain-containing protein n=1 Tax=Pleurodeles waltl TaxID=8319 RepID=A0AAV7SV08_PLEWA|nr:hypothetical protein NDU88_008358 [Pleurodeles waltl]
MSSPRLCLALLLLVAGKSGAQSVSQTPEKLLVPEGSPLFLNCTYKVSGYPYLFWYFQPPGEAPQLLLKEHGQEEQKGFSAPHNRSERKGGAGKGGMRRTPKKKERDPK